MASTLNTILIPVEGGYKAYPASDALLAQIITLLTQVVVTPPKTDPVKPDPKPDPVTPKAFTILPPVVQNGNLVWQYEGGDGTQPEFMAMGVTGWTKDNFKLKDKYAADFKPIKVQGRQSGKEATSVDFDLLKAMAAQSPSTGNQTDGAKTDSQKTPQTTAEGVFVSYKQDL